jgi:hypothetical protein
MGGASSGKPASSLEQIRARFHTIKTEQENKAVPAVLGAASSQNNNVQQSPAAPLSKIATLTRSDSNNSDQLAEQHAQPAAAPAGSSQLLALRARVAAMNKKA